MHVYLNIYTYIFYSNQVPRILGPIVICLQQVERIYNEDEAIRKMIDHNHQGLDTVKKDILYDFFKCAFDGSGKSFTIYHTGIDHIDM